MTRNNSNNPDDNSMFFDLFGSQDDFILTENEDGSFDTRPKPKSVEAMAREIEMECCAFV